MTAKKFADTDRPAPLGAPVSQPPAAPTAATTTSNTDRPAPNAKPETAPVTAPKSPPVVTKPTGASNKQKSYVAPADFAAVMEMQKAILDFGRAAAGTDAFQMSPQGTGVQQATTGEYLGGHDPFSSFLFSNYLNVSTDKPGQGFIATENLNQKTRMDTATKRPDVGSLRNWVETIMHVGSPGKGGEYRADGVWGPRTNNGLKAIADFSEMMFEFAKDMGVSLDEFPTKGLAEFRSKIPNVDASGKLEGNNVILAKVMTSYIKTLTGVVTTFKNKIMESPSFKNYLSQDQALLKGKNKSLEGQDMVAFQLHSSVPLNVGETPYKGITLDDLSSKDKFVEFLKKVNVPIDRPEEVLNSINLVRSYLEQNDKGQVL